MRGTLYNILLCCALCVVLVDAAAQVPWESIDDVRQRKTLASRSLPESVLRLYDTDCECDEQTLDDAVAQLTVRCKNKNRASLYAYLYDRLHDQRRVDAATDAAVFALYAEYMLARRAVDADRHGLCGWAYTLARHYAAEGGAEHFEQDMKHSLGKRIKRYAQSCDLLMEYVRTALRSFEYGSRMLLDETSPRRAAVGFVGITHEEYAAEAAAAQPLTTLAPNDSPLYRDMYDELLRRDAVCCRAVAAMWPEVECIACSTASGDRIVVTGSDGMGVTLPSPVMASASGILLSVERGGVWAAEVSSDATVEHIGFAMLPEGRLLQMTSSGDAVNVEIATSGGTRCYQWLLTR